MCQHSQSRILYVDKLVYINLYMKSFNAKAAKENKIQTNSK